MKSTTDSGPSSSTRSRPGGESGFRTWPLAQASRDEMRENRFPTTVSAWSHGQLELTGESQPLTHFGFVQAGPATLRCGSGEFVLAEKMYFAVPGGAPASRIGGPGSGLLITSHHHRGLFQVGGPIEPTGRLRYIDGCTDTLLLSPVMKGDPCLNLLHIPPRTRQTSHTHPSLRAGLIVAGRGRCLTREGETDLLPGQVFIIPQDTLHGFLTEEEDLLIIAYHPDSDSGPAHQDHPMLNRTFVEGVSMSGQAFPPGGRAS